MAERQPCFGRRLFMCARRAFGEGKDEPLDLFHAAHGAPAPVLVFYHDGYWRSADKAWFHFIARPFVKRGPSSGFPIKGTTAISCLFDLEPIRLTSLHQDLRLTAAEPAFRRSRRRPLMQHCRG
ncbi:hypothetical protein ABVB72_25780 [Rhizobium nepotum]|uniref:hypothetical protein n=1 Tax=Rhizobium nepotum TaxID=1035271 RepID=UPI00336A86B2